MTLMETSMVETESTASLKVLVIEDDNEMASFIEKVLADAGHKVERVADGASGLARARASEFDALIVDRMLPEKDGLTLLQEFRAAGGTTPALFLSALGDVQNKVQGLRAGAEDYLAKPFAPAELAARVEALGRRQTSAEPPVTAPGTPGANREAGSPGSDGVPRYTASTSGSTTHTARWSGVPPSTVRRCESATRVSRATARTPSTRAAGPQT